MNYLYSWLHNETKELSFVDIFAMLQITNTCTSAKCTCILIKHHILFGLCTSLWGFKWKSVIMHILTYKQHYLRKVSNARYCKLMTWRLAVTSFYRMTCEHEIVGVIFGGSILNYVFVHMMRR